MVFHWSLRDCKSPGFFLIFWPIAPMYRWSPLLLFLSLSVSSRILRWLYQASQLQLVSPSFSCSIVFQFSSNVLVLISLFPFLQFYPVVSWNGKVLYLAGPLGLLFFFFFFLLTSTRFGCLAEIRWSICISKLQKILCRFLGRFQGCAYTICCYGQI